MKRILFFFFLFGIQSSYAQVFETVFTDVEDMQIPTDMIEVNDGYIVSVLERNTYWRLKVIKIDKAGMEIARIQYQERIVPTEAGLTILSDTSFLFNYLYRTEDSIRCIYRVLNNRLEEIAYGEADPEITVTDNPNCFSRITLMPSGNIVHSFSTYSTAELEQYTCYLIKTDPLLSYFSQRSHKFPKMIYTGITLQSALSYRESDTLLLFFHGEGHKFDQNLSLIESYPEDFFTFIEPGYIRLVIAASSQWLSDGSLIMGGPSFRMSIAKYNPDLSKKVIHVLKNLYRVTRVIIGTVVDVPHVVE